MINFINSLNDIPEYPEYRVVLIHKARPLLTASDLRIYIDILDGYDWQSSRA